jgi:phosphoglycerate dehydrogenase-like enzyme
LRAIAPDLRIEQQPMFATVDDLPAALWREVEVLFTFRAFPTREEAPRLRWIQLNSAGAEAALSHSTYLHSPIQLTNLSGIHAVPIAEHVFTVLLSWRHRLPRMLEWQSEAFWPRQDEVRRVMDFDELYGQTLGVVGYGSIGRHVARIARAFGMRVLALHRGDDHRDRGYVVPGTGDPEGTLPERFFSPRELHALLAESDVVVLALPATAATDGFIQEAALLAMKPSAFLVNVGRGNAIDEVALQRALAEGWLAGAALDVVRHEPLPADHWLWQAPNVMVTPHVSGISPRYEERSAELFAENLRRYIAGAPLLNLVEPQRGY